MSKSIKILLQIEDFYFKTGLIYFLNLYFKSRRYEVLIMNDDSSDIPDYIFTDTHNDLSPFYCHKNIKGDMVASRIIIVRTDENINHGTHCNNLEGVLLCYNKNLFEIKMDLYDILDGGHSNHYARYCRYCKSVKLTSREFEVIYLLWKGYTQPTLPALMQSNRRNVSRHKRSAMYKLQFTNSLRFYNWLIKVNSETLNSLPR